MKSFLHETFTNLLLIGYLRFFGCFSLFKLCQIGGCCRNKTFNVKSEEKRRWDSGNPVDDFCEYKWLHCVHLVVMLFNSCMRMMRIVDIWVPLNVRWNYEKIESWAFDRNILRELFQAYLETQRIFMLFEGSLKVWNFGGPTDTGTVTVNSVTYFWGSFRG